MNKKEKVGVKISNDTKASHACDAICKYLVARSSVPTIYGVPSILNSSTEQLQDYLTDLLIALRHYSKKYGLNFEESNDISKENFGFDIMAENLGKTEKSLRR